MLRLREDGHKTGARVGDWCIHEDGFAFRIPDGLTLLGAYRGATLLLVDESKADARQLTTITLSVVGEDETLDKLTPTQVKSAWSGGFSRFKLLSFERLDICGEEGVRISFVAGDSPQLLIQQRLFNKGGRSYIITLSCENSFPSLHAGLEQLSVFCDSLIFMGDLTAAQR